MVAKQRWWATVDFWMYFEVGPIGFIVGTVVREIGGNGRVSSLAWTGRMEMLVTWDEEN